MLIFKHLPEGPGTSWDFLWKQRSWQEPLLHSSPTLLVQADMRGHSHLPLPCQSQQVSTVPLKDAPSSTGPGGRVRSGALVLKRPHGSATTGQTILAGYHPQSTADSRLKDTLSLPVKKAYLLLLELPPEGQASGLPHSYWLQRCSQGT